MPNNWKTYKLNEIADILNSKRIPLNSRQRNDRKGIFPYYGASGVVDFIDDFIFDGEHVLISEDGENLRSRNTPIAFKAKGKFWVNNHAHIVKGKEEFLNNWIVYHFSNLDLNPYISGAVQPKLNKEALLSIPIKIPQFDEAKQIVTILSAIDDKIENNLAINKTLEEMAMALYKHWFVDFGPFQDGEFVESELGRIPKGWEVKRLVEFVNLTMGQSPKSEFYNLNNEGLPFHQGVTNYGERFPEDKTYSTEGNRFAEEGDILFSVRAPVGRLNIAKNKIILGRGLSSMTLKNHDNNGFLFYSLKNFFTEDDKIGDGTVYGSVNKTELENLKFIVPCKEVLNNFNDLVKDIDSKYLNNYRENQSLTQLRDTLLPKLISGEVRLKEFQES